MEPEILEELEKAFTTKDAVVQNEEYSERDKEIMKIMMALYGINQEPEPPRRFGNAPPLAPKGSW